MTGRYGEYSRKTYETDISAAIAIDGGGKADVSTGIGFFDHMLTLFAKHGLFDLTVKCTGDLYVDGHHSVEDTGICLGAAFKKALGDKAGIKRMCTFFAPMDESLAFASVDISGRPYLAYDVKFSGYACGAFSVQLAEEFFRAFCNEAGITLHIKLLYGANDHHILEAVFKAFARALDGATQIDGRVIGIPSTKGVL